MSTLKVNSIIPVAGVPTGGGGGIIQVKNTTFKSRTSVSTTGGSFVHFNGIDVSITPITSSSKILISGGIVGEGSSQDGQFKWKLQRSIGGASDADIDCVGTTVSNRPGVTGSFPAGHSASDQDSTTTIVSWANILDSPSTTSAITYKFKIFARDNSANFVFCGTQGDNDNQDYERSVCYMTVMEVSA
tara:strand:+ start:50 stop:613 length:564 start_codon:yes stop_codon:yes gene_type:complete